MDKIDILVFLAFRVEYFQSNRNERFGQAFLNKFCPDVRDNHLFYEVDSDRAENYILDHYVGVEKNVPEPN